MRGRELWLSFAGADFGEGVVYTFRDLTEERRLEELKSEFVATASHELRTPLAAVYGAAMTLRREDIDLDEERRRTLVDLVASESDRLAKIVNDILWASRIDSAERGRRDRARRRARPSPVASSTRRRRIFRSRVELVLEADDSVPLVAADDGKLSQVLANLVDNAVKYSPDGGRVTVSLRPDARNLVLEVSDEGLGIPPAEHERIFEKFYRLDPNLTRGVGGTGLGLYICRALVERMDGRISVRAREEQGNDVRRGARARCLIAAFLAAPRVGINGSVYERGGCVHRCWHDSSHRSDHSSDRLRLLRERTTHD